MIQKVGSVFQPDNVTLQANLAKQLARNRELAAEAQEAARKRADEAAASRENQKQIRDIKARTESLNATERITEERAARRETSTFSPESLDAFAINNSFEENSERVGRFVDERA